MKALSAVLLSLLLVFSGCGMPGATPAPQSTGVLVMVGAGGSIARSLDGGVTWETSMANPNLPASKTLTGNYIFGGNVRVLGSFNQGAQQAAINSQAAAGLIANAAGNSVAFAGDLYAKGTLYQQLGQQWSGLIANPFGINTLNCITFGNGTYMVGGLSATIGTSNDYGATWTSRANNFAGGDTVVGIAYGGGVWVACSTAGKTSWSSNNGVAWSVLIDPGIGQLSGVAFGNGVFVAVSEANGKTAYSTDLGQTWHIVVTTVPILYCISFGNGIFVAGGAGPILISKDLGLSWNVAIVPFAVGDLILGIAYGNGIFVAVSTSGHIARSPDGSAWGSLITNPFGTGGVDLYSVSYNLGIFQIAGSGGKTARSYDNSVTWGGFVTNPFGTNNIYGIASSPQTTSGTSNFVAVGAVASIATSGWNAVPLGTGGAFYAPLPQSPAGVGQYVQVTAAAGASFSYPAGGVWLSNFLWYSSPGQLVGGYSGGIANGGTVINVGTAGIAWSGNFWRLA